MALGSALVDRARIVRNTPQPRKVEGRTQMAKVKHAWFRCRLTLPQRPHSNDPSNGRRRTDSRPSLLYGLRDADGEPVDLSPEDEVEIESKELGTALWRLDAAPEPLRKRRSLVGYEVRLRAVEKREFEPRTV